MEQNYQGNKSRDNISPVTQMGAEKQTTDLIDIMDGDLCFGNLEQLDIERKTCTVSVNGWRFKDIPWMLPHLNSQKGTGIDYTPSLETESLKKVIVAVIEGRAVVIGVLPKEDTSQSKQESDQNYAKGRNKDLKKDDVEIVTDQENDTRFYLSSASKLLAKVREKVEVFMNAASKKIEMWCDNFNFNTPGTSAEVQVDESSHRASFSMTQKASETDGDTMFDVFIGSNEAAGQVEPITQINVRNTETAFDNILDINAEDNIEVSTSGEGKEIGLWAGDDEKGAANSKIITKSIGNIKLESSSEIKEETGIKTEQANTINENASTIDMDTSDLERDFDSLTDTGGSVDKDLGEVHQDTDSYVIEPSDFTVNSDGEITLTGPNEMKLEGSNININADSNVVINQGELGVARKQDQVRVTIPPGALTIPYVTLSGPKSTTNSKAVQVTGQITTASQTVKAG